MAAPNMKISPRRASDGFPMQRLQLICAVIEKRLKLSLWNRDVYLNVVGGLRVSEPASDLAVAVTITSSLVGMKIKAGICFIGEIGLSGEIRRIKGLEIRIAEAVKMGFTTIIIPDLGPKNPFKKRKISNFSRVEKSDVKIRPGDSDVNIDYDNDISNNDNDENDNTDHDNESDQNNINEEFENKKKKNKDDKNSGHEVISCSTLVQALTIALEVENFGDILDKLKNSSRKKRKNSTSENQEKSKWPSRSIEKENNFYDENNNEFKSNMNRNSDSDDDYDDDYDDDIDENY
jgi:Subunit ChlI of Mg-chelatase